MATDTLANILDSIGVKGLTEVSDPDMHAYIINFEADRLEIIAEYELMLYDNPELMAQMIRASKQARAKFNTVATKKLLLQIYGCQKYCKKRTGTKTLISRYKMLMNEATYKHGPLTTCIRGTMRQGHMLNSTVKAMATRLHNVIAVCLRFCAVQRMQPHWVLLGNYHEAFLDIDRGCDVDIPEYVPKIAAKRDLTKHMYVMYNEETDSYRALGISSSRYFGEVVEDLDFRQSVLGYLQGSEKCLSPEAVTTIRTLCNLSRKKCAVYTKLILNIKAMGASAADYRKQYALECWLLTAIKKDTSDLDKNPLYKALYTADIKSVCAKNNGRLLKIIKHEPEAKHTIPFILDIDVYDTMVLCEDLLNKVIKYEFKNIQQVKISPKHIINTWVAETTKKYDKRHPKPNEGEDYDYMITQSIASYESEKSLHYLHSSTIH